VAGEIAEKRHGAHPTSGGCRGRAPPAAAINAQQLSENDIFALYCLGTFRVVGAASADSYLTAFPTGNEQHCDWIRKASKSNEDGLRIHTLVKAVVT
jgi:hypothetical protein